METETSYRYEALNDGSYNDLAAYAINLMGNVSLFPELRTIVIDGRFAKDVSKFIDTECLDVIISAIEIDDENLATLIHTEAIDTATLRSIIDRLIEQSNSMAEKHNSIMAEITKERDLAREAGDAQYRWRKEEMMEADRIRHQVKAIATLINSIYPE